MKQITTSFQILNRFSNLLIKFNEKEWCLISYHFSQTHRKYLFLFKCIKLDYCSFYVFYFLLIEKWRKIIIFLSYFAISDKLQKSLESACNLLLNLLRLNGKFFCCFSILFFFLHCICFYFVLHAKVIFNQKPLFFIISSIYKNIFLFISNAIFLTEINH